VAALSTDLVTAVQAGSGGSCLIGDEARSTTRGVARPERAHLYLPAIRAGMDPQLAAGATRKIQAEQEAAAAVLTVGSWLMGRRSPNHRRPT
jgi:hypothetical protein